MNLEKRLAGLSGKRIEEGQLRLLQENLTIPSRWLQLFTSFPLARVRLSLAEEDDASGFGAEMQFMDVAEMASEAFDTYPGIVAVRLGYTPLGICLEGSGDPYFLRADGAVVRIPHDSATEDTLDESRVEEVAHSLDELLTKGALE